MPREATLDLGVIGNGSYAALIDDEARVVWGCLPAFDGDPAFCALLQPVRHEGGDFAVELVDQVATEQRYLDNTAVLAKPFNLEKLAEAISAVVATSQRASRRAN